MLGSKQYVSNFHEFGVEGWLYRRADQRSYSKFEPMGICYFYRISSSSARHQGFLVWCPAVVLFELKLPTTLCLELDVLDCHCRLLNYLTNGTQSLTEIPLPCAPAVHTLHELAGDVFCQ